MATITVDAAIRSRHLARALAVAGATTATLAVWAIAGPLAGIDLAVRLGSGIGHIGPARVAGATALVNNTKTTGPLFRVFGTPLLEPPYVETEYDAEGNRYDGAPA